MEAKKVRLAKVSIGKTLRLSNEYQSAEFRVDIELPCKKDAIDETYEEALGLVDNQLEKVVQSSLETTQNMVELSKNVIQ